MKKIIFILTLCVSYVHLFALDPELSPTPVQKIPTPAVLPQSPGKNLDPVQTWIDGIKRKVIDLRSLETVQPDAQQTADGFSDSEHNLKENIYYIIADAQKMIHPRSPVHKAFPGNNDGLSWYQRWLGFAFDAKTPYQYFEKNIFPLIDEAPLYQDLADQGVLVLVEAYVKELGNQITTIQKKFPNQTKSAYVQALEQLKEAFGIYAHFLLKNKEWLPRGSFNKIASNPIVRHLFTFAGVVPTGVATAAKLGLNPRQILAEKKEMTEEFAKGVSPAEKLKAASTILQKGIQEGSGKAKEIATSAKNLSWIEKGRTWWNAGKQGVKTGIETIKGTTESISQGNDLEKIAPGVAKTSGYAYQKAVESIYGKILATAVVSYITYKTIQWMLKDWPRNKFTPSGQAH